MTIQRCSLKSISHTIESFHTHTHTLTCFAAIEVAALSLSVISRRGHMRLETIWTIGLSRAKLLITPAHPYTGAALPWELRTWFIVTALRACHVRDGTVHISTGSNCREYTVEISDTVLSGECAHE